MQKVLLLFITLTISLFSSVFTVAQSDYIKTLRAHRDSVDREFANPETSILEKKDLKAFDGLPYFAIDTTFRVKAQFERIKGGEVFEMKTTTDRLPKYRPYGKLTFTLKGKPLELTVYQNIELMRNPVYRDYLFIPFTDLTNGESTYGGGRYLDLSAKALDANTVIDFNYAYHPYCVYSKKYSCPIPPAENHLDIAVEAGVKL
jgi:hypothetical protein